MLLPRSAQNHMSLSLVWGQGFIYCYMSTLALKSTGGNDLHSLHLKKPGRKSADFLAPVLITAIIPPIKKIQCWAHEIIQDCPSPLKTFLASPPLMSIP